MISAIIANRAEIQLSQAIRNVNKIRYSYTFGSDEMRKKISKILKKLSEAQDELNEFLEVVRISNESRIS